MWKSHYVASQIYRDKDITFKDSQLKIKLKKPVIHHEGVTFKLDTIIATAYFKHLIEYDYPEDIEIVTEGVHPHISGDEPCLGGFYEDIHKTLFAGHFAAAKDLLNFWASSYNNDDAYSNIYVLAGKAIHCNGCHVVVFNKDIVNVKSYLYCRSCGDVYL